MNITETDTYVEQWLPVIGFEGLYEVSNIGRVRSIDRVNVNRLGVRRILKGKMLKLSSDGEGYAQVGLLRCGKETKARVHRLVANAFIANPEGLPLVDHRDRNRGRNGEGNLRWATYAQNRANSRQTGADLEAAASSAEPT
jgi:hypothetical protein